MFLRKQRINFVEKNEAKNNEMNSFGKMKFLRINNRAEAYFLANENLLFLEIS